MSDPKPPQKSLPVSDEQSTNTPQPPTPPPPDDDPFTMDLELIGEQVRHFDLEEDEDPDNEES